MICIASFRDGCDAFKDAKLRWPSVRSLDRPPCSPGKPTRFPGRQKPSQFRSVREVCGGLRTEFRPFSLFCAQNRPPVSARKIPFPGPRDGEAGAEASRSPNFCRACAGLATRGLLNARHFRSTPSSSRRRPMQTTAGGEIDAGLSKRRRRRKSYDESVNEPANSSKLNWSRSRRKFRPKRTNRWKRSSGTTSLKRPPLKTTNRHADRAVMAPFSANARFSTHFGRSDPLPSGAGSCSSAQKPMSAHAPSTPVAVHPVIRPPADLSQKRYTPLVLTTLVS